MNQINTNDILKFGLILRWEKKTHEWWLLPPIASNGMAFGSFDVPSVGRTCLNVFNRFILRRINYTYELNNKQKFIFQQSDIGPIGLLFVEH